MIDAWLIWFPLFFALGWFLRSIGKRRAGLSEIRDSVRQLARFSIELDKRVRRLEGRDSSDDPTEDEFLRRFDL